MSPDTDHLWPIGTAAKMLGVSVDTLRIWEDKGKIESAGRTDGGHRQFRQSEIDRLIRVNKRSAKVAS